MSKIPEELEHQTLTECGYSFPVETLNDTRGVRAAYRDLRLYLDFYCSRKQNRKKLLYLTGTIPVPLHGNVYNIPVCIWLHETHPVSRPRCSVCPSFYMVINPACPYVDLHGNITLSYLSNWTTDVSSLSGLVAEMRRAFQQATPLYATLPVPLGVSCSRRPSLISNLPAADRQSERSGQGMQRSYTEELLGIDFSAPPPSSSPRPLFPSPSPGEVESALLPGSSSCLEGRALETRGRPGEEP